MGVPITSAKKSIDMKNPIDALDLDRDPLAYAFHYARQFWFQQMCPVRTRCFRCGNDSPIVYVPHGSVAFGNPKEVARGDTDITKDVVMAFAQIDWKFQRHKSYCPACKGLGGI